MELVKAIKNSHFAPLLEIGGPGVKIVGRATSYEVKPSTLKRENGEDSYYAKFSGDFLVILPNGEQLRSGVLFAPEILEQPIKTAIDNARHNEEGEVESVEFGFELFKRDDRANAKNARGYVWGVKSLTPAKPETDPLLLLAAAVVGKSEA